MSYEIPTEEREARLLRKEIAENRDLIRFTPVAKQNDIASIGAGSHDTAIGVVTGNFVLNPQIMYESVKISWTGGTGGELNVGDVIKTDIDPIVLGVGTGWRGKLLHIVSGDEIAGTGIFEPQWLDETAGTPRPEFDDASTTLINETTSGWTASYTASSKAMGNLVIYSASMIVDKMEGGDPNINVIYGATNDGQFTTIKPKEGKTLTLSQNGNIDTANDVSIDDTSGAILQFHSDNTTPDSGGNWTIITGGAGGGSSSLLKDPVKTATQVNYVSLALVGENIDGVVVVQGDRVLVKAQSNQVDNGIYSVTSVAGGIAVLDRSSDMPDGSIQKEGTMTFVQDGTTDAEKLFAMNIGGNEVDVGTDAQNWGPIGGEQTPWASNIDASGFVLNNLEQVSFVDDLNNPMGFIAGQTDAMRIQVPTGDKDIAFREDPYATDILYINRYGINQGHTTGGGGVNVPINPSAGFISIGNDEYITWRNSTNTNDALLRFNASDQFEFNLNGTAMLKIDQPNTLVDFEQNDITRVNNLNSYTGDHDIGNTDPFHRIFADRFIPVSENYASGTTGELRKNDFATYIDLQASGTFDIRRDGVGRGGLLTDGSDPWFRFTLGAGTAPNFKVYHNNLTDPVISFDYVTGQEASLYYSIANESLTIKNTVDDPANLKGIRFNVAGSDIASLVSTGFHPITDDSHQLGTSTKRWSEIISSGNVYGTSFVMDVGGQNNRITSGISPSYTMEFKLNGEDAMKLSKEFTTDSVLEINGNPDPTYKLRSTKTSLTGQIGTVAFDAFDSDFVLPHTYAYISSEIADGTSTNKKGKLIFNVTSGNDPNIPYMELDGSAEETKFLKTIDMQNNQIRGVGSIDFDGVASTIEGLTNLNFFHTGNQISSVTDFFYFTDNIHRFQVLGSDVVNVKSDRLDVFDHSIEFTETTDPTTPAVDHGLLYAKDNGGTSSLYWLNNSGTPIELGGSGGSTSFIGFTADADLDMGTFDIKGVDRFTFATTEGAGDSLGPQDTGIDAIYATGLPFGMRINVPTNNSAVLQISRGGVDKYTLTSLGHTFSDVVRFGANYTVFNARTAVSHTTPSQRYLFQDSSDNHLKIRTDSGLVDLESAGGGGSEFIGANNFHKSHSTYAMWYPVNMLKHPSKEYSLQNLGGGSYQLNEVTSFRQQTSSGILNYTWAYPLYIDGNYTLAEIRPYVFGAGSSQYYVGIYTNQTNGTLYPQTKLDDTSAQFINYSGFGGTSGSQGEFDYALSAGVYWIVFKFVGNTSTVFSHTIARHFNGIGFDADQDINTDGEAVGWVNIGTGSGSLPTSFPSITDVDTLPITDGVLNLITTGTMPVMFARFT